jgi:hypothetical protein
MEIEIKRTITAEYQDKVNSYTEMLNDLESFLNESFKTKSYGESVVKYFFGFELYKFDGPFAQFFSSDIESWKTKSKWLVTNAHFDWSVFVNLNMDKTLKLIIEEFSKSIGRIEKMKRKPKNFDFKSFQKDFEVITSNYQLRNNAG